MFIYDTPPCKNCEKRCVACHTTCEDYKNWKIDHENRRNAFIEKKWVDEQIRASKIEFSERYWRKINKKRK